MGRKGRPTDPEKLSSYVREHISREEFREFARTARTLEEYQATIAEELISRVGYHPGFDVALTGEKMRDYFFEPVFVEAVTDIVADIIERAESALEREDYEEAESVLHEAETHAEKIGREKLPADVTGRMERVETKVRDYRIAKEEVEPRLTGAEDLMREWTVSRESFLLEEARDLLDEAESYIAEMKEPPEALIRRLEKDRSRLEGYERRAKRRRRRRRE